MKPIVVIVNDKLTKEDVEHIINEAYTAGWNDGYAAGKTYVWPYYTPSISDPYNPSIIYTDKTYKTDFDKITCEDIYNNFSNTVHNLIEKYTAELKL